MSTPTPGQPEYGQPNHGRPQQPEAAPATGSGTPAPPYGAPATPPAYGTPPQAPPYAAPGAYPAPAYPAPAYQPPAYPAPGYQGGAQQYYGGYGPRTNTLSIIAMIASILGFIWILPFIGSLAGAIMGHISLGQIKKSGEKGRGMALAGVIVGWAGLGLIILAVLGFLAFAATVSTTSVSLGV